MIGNGALEVKAPNHAFNWLNASLQLIEKESYSQDEKLSLLDKLANSSLQVSKEIYKKYIIKNHMRRGYLTD